MRMSAIPPPVDFMLDIARHTPAALAVAPLVPFTRHLRVAFHGRRRALKYPLSEDLLRCFDRIFSMELYLVRLDASMLRLGAAPFFTNLTYLIYHEHPLCRKSATLVLFGLFQCMPALQSLHLIDVRDRGYNGSLIGPKCPPPPFRLRVYYYYGSEKFPFCYLPLANSKGTLDDLKICFPRGAFDCKKLEAVAAVCDNLRKLELEGRFGLRGLCGTQALVKRCERLRSLTLIPANVSKPHLENIATFVLGSLSSPIRELELGEGLQQVIIERLARDGTDIPQQLRALRVLLLHYAAPGPALDAVRQRFARRRVRVVCMGSDAESA
ncbi:hypothetical protein AURDEDRAFT_121560 [Auricularia subglabra TFB-10046 SS5]|nr:hypothetical protein AURDEDRAFT_121560 [Auricularia subglabra TFB-10046 SS5]